MFMYREAMYSAILQGRMDIDFYLQRRTFFFHLSGCCNPGYQFLVYLDGFEF